MNWLTEIRIFITETFRKCDISVWVLLAKKSIVPYFQRERVDALFPEN